MNKDELLDSEIRKAIEWLDSEQSPDAVLTHLGISLVEHAGTTKLSFTPCGAGGKPVFVFDDEREYHGWGPGDERPRWAGYTEEEIELFRKIVSRHATIAQEWNGVEMTTFSIKLARDAGPAIDRCIANYRSVGSGVFSKNWWQGRIRARRPLGWR